MNNLHIPFATAHDELAALQKRAEYYETKLQSLAITMSTVNLELRKREIRYIQKLHHQCQAAIAFLFSRTMPKIK